MDMTTLLNGIRVFLEKLGTMIIDRRLLFYIFVVVGTVLGLPQLTDNADTLNKELVDAITLIIQGVTAIVGLVTLLISWTKRPPSGQNYREAVDVARYIEHYK